MSKTVKEIIAEYLTVNEFDGLCCDECGCQLSDLIPCGQACDRCVPGYRVLSKLYGLEEVEGYVIREKKPT